jgi:hypothetical protein
MGLDLRFSHRDNMRKCNGKIEAWNTPLNMEFEGQGDHQPLHHGVGWFLLCSAQLQLHLPVPLRDLEQRNHSHLDALGERFLLFDPDHKHRLEHVLVG